MHSPHTVRLHSFLRNLRHRVCISCAVSAVHGSGANCAACTASSRCCTVSRFVCGQCVCRNSANAASSEDTSAASPQRRILRWSAQNSACTVCKGVRLARRRSAKAKTSSSKTVGSTHKSGTLCGVSAGESASCRASRGVSLSAAFCPTCAAVSYTHLLNLKYSAVL